MILISISQNLNFFTLLQKTFWSEKYFVFNPKIFQDFLLQQPPTQRPTLGVATPGTPACWLPATLQVFVFPSPSQTSWPSSTCMLSTTEEKYFIILKIFGKLKQKSFAWPHYCKHPLGKRGRNQNYLCYLGLPDWNLSSFEIFSVGREDFYSWFPVSDV